MTVCVAEDAADAPDDASRPAAEPLWVAFASHDGRGADLRRRWDDPDLERVGAHLVVYVGAGSHSAACVPGDCLVTVAPDLPRWPESLRARMARIVPWWDPETLGIGIPFIDYRRGDGLSVGPGQDRAWVPHVIDDATDWVREYAGLWGLDTGDPLGGERAPAGPRYERTGAVRQSWSAPVVWADLDGEPTSDRQVAQLWKHRQARIAETLRRVDARLDEARLDLRFATMADRVAGLAPLEPSPERARARSRLMALRARQAHLSDLLEAAAKCGPSTPTEVAPQSHLRRRALPLGQDAAARSRALRVWASASGTILFAALGLVLIFGGASIVVPVVAQGLGMLLIEAAVRRRLLALVANLVVVALLVIAAVAVVRLLLENLRVGLGIVLLVAAACMGLLTIGDAFVRRNASGH